MMLVNFIGFFVHFMGLLCWSVGEYLLIEVKEEKYRDVIGESDNELHPWKDLEDDEIISLSPAGLSSRAAPIDKCTDAMRNN